MLKLTKKQIVVRSIVSLPILPISLVLKLFIKIGEFADDVEYKLSRFWVTKVLRKLDDKIN